MKRRLQALLVAAAFAAIHPLPASAQEHVAPKAEATTSHVPEAASHEAAPAADGHATPISAEHGKAADAHAEGGHGGGHHAPPIHLFGSGGPELGSFAQWLVKAFNFAIFAGALVFALKGVLASAFKARAKELEERLGQAERDKAEGEAQIQALEAKMAGLQAELDGILGKAAEEAETERQRIVSAARLEADAILAQARFDVESQIRQAEQELRGMVADLAVEAARTRLQAQFSAGAAERALDQAIAKVGGAQ